MKTLTERDQVERYVKDVANGKTIIKPEHMSCDEQDIKNYIERGIDQPKDLNHLGHVAWKDLLSSEKSEANEADGLFFENSPGGSFTSGVVVGTGYLIVIGLVKGVTVATATAFLMTNAVKLIGVTTAVVGAFKASSYAVDKAFVLREYRRRKQIEKDGV